MPSVLKVNEVQSDTDLPLVFNVGNAERGRIDTSGNMGLGVTPSAWSTPALQMSRGSFTSLGGGPNDHAAVVANAYTSSGTDPAFVTWRYVNTGAAALYQAGNGGQHRWSSASSGTAGNTFSFTQILAANLNETLALQGAVPQTGTGITFPATQNASTNANTLDDYEEGTWTPAITYGDSTGTVTFSDATYTKVGRLVTIFLTMTPATTFSVNSSSGTPRITALPFTPAVFSAGNFVVNIAGAPQTYFLTAAIHSNAWILLPSFAATSNVFHFAGIYYV